MWKLVCSQMGKKTQKTALQQLSSLYQNCFSMAFRLSQKQGLSQSRHPDVSFSFSVREIESHQESIVRWYTMIVKQQVSSTCSSVLTTFLAPSNHNPNDFKAILPHWAARQQTLRVNSGHDERIRNQPRGHLISEQEWMQGKQEEINESQRRTEVTLTCNLTSCWIDWLSSTIVPVPLAFCSMNSFI